MKPLQILGIWYNRSTWQEVIRPEMIQKKYFSQIKACRVGDGTQFPDIYKFLAI